MSSNKINQMKSILKNNKTRVKEDSSDISSYDSDDDNMTNADIQKKAKETYIKNDLFDRITKYIKLDNSIKEKQQELREFTKTAEDKSKFLFFRVIAELLL